MNGEQLWFKINQIIGNKQIDIKTIPSNHRWANGETHIRQEVRTKSRNTAYIFGLIDKFI